MDLEYRLSAHMTHLGMTLNCLHIFIVTGGFLFRCVMKPASQHFFIQSCIYLRILIISYLATFLGTNSLSVLMCRKAIYQSIHCSYTNIAATHALPLLQDVNPSSKNGFASWIILVKIVCC